MRQIRRPAPREGDSIAGTQRGSTLKCGRERSGGKVRPLWAVGALTTGNVVIRRRACKLRKMLGKKRQVQNQGRTSLALSSWEPGEKMRLARRLQLEEEGVETKTPKVKSADGKREFCTSTITWQRLNIFSC